MSFSTSENTTKVCTGVWQKVDGKMSFIERNYKIQYLDMDLASNVIDSSYQHDYLTKISESRTNSNSISSFEDQLEGCNNEILPLLLDLKNEIRNLREENISLKEQVKVNKKELERQCLGIYQLEDDLTRLERYGRRGNIEISGIPTRVLDNHLEDEVLKILHKIGLSHLDHFGIVACHRVGSRDKFGNRNTIVRFLNRKDAIKALKSKNNLKFCRDIGYKYLNIMENLCPFNKSIYEEMLGLQRDG